MTEPVRPPLYIRIHPADNVAIVANDGGLKAGAVFADGLALVDNVPQGHKVALADLAEGEAIRRYDVVIGYAQKALPRGSWVHERVMRMPTAPELDGLPIATVKPPPMAPLEGFSFEGYRNADGSVGTRNILAITQTVQCVAGVTEFALQRIKRELLPKYPNVDDVVALEHGYGCGVAIDAPDAIVPIRTLRNISLNPNFGGEVMVVSLGCEKLQPERLLPPGSIPIADGRDADLDVVCLQDDEHVGFMSMIDSVMRQAEQHLARLNARRRETVPASELVVGVQCGGSGSVGDGGRMVVQAPPSKSADSSGSGGGGGVSDAGLVGKAGAGAGRRTRRRSTTYYVNGAPAGARAQSAESLSLDAARVTWSEVLSDVVLPATMAYCWGGTRFAALMTAEPAAVVVDVSAEPTALGAFIHAGTAFGTAISGVGAELANVE